MKYSGIFVYCEGMVFIWCSSDVNCAMVFLIPLHTYVPVVEIHVPVCV